MPVLVDYGLVMAEPTSNPVSRGWWKTKAGWKHWSRALPGEASPWPQFIVGVVGAIAILLIAGWEHWPMASMVVLIGGAGFVSRRVLWSLAGLVLMAALVFWSVTD